MKERKEVARSYVDQGHKVDVCLEAAKVSSSSFYYEFRPGKKGKNASEYTRKTDGSSVPNSEVVDQIRQLLAHEFVDYGYLKVTHWLRKRAGFLINKKKVYRLMKEHKLLACRKQVQRNPRTWVTDLVPQPDGVFSHLEIDIKYIYVHGAHSNALQLTVLDVKTRYVMGYVMGYGIRGTDVVALFDEIFALFDMPDSFYIRSDNGSQFIAAEVRKYFDAQPGAQQEFTRPATPQQNGHIEAFHSIVHSVLCLRFCFQDLQDLWSTMTRFIEFYNTDRLHSGLKYECPLFEIRKARPNFNPQFIARQSYSTMGKVQFTNNTPQIKPSINLSHVSLN